MYIINLAGFSENTYYLCKGIQQYGFGENPLFQYFSYISIKRKISLEEAELLYEIVTANSNLNAGESLETIKLK